MPLSSQANFLERGPLRANVNQTAARRVEWNLFFKSGILLLAPDHANVNGVVSYLRPFSLPFHHLLLSTTWFTHSGPRRRAHDNNRVPVTCFRNRETWKILMTLPSNVRNAAASVSGCRFWCMGTMPVVFESKRLALAEPTSFRKKLKM